MVGVDKRYLYRKWLTQRIENTNASLAILFQQVEIEGIDPIKCSLELFKKEYAGRLFLHYPSESDMIRELLAFRRILQKKRRIAWVLLNEKCQLYREYRWLLMETFRSDRG